MILTVILAVENGLVMNKFCLYNNDARKWSCNDNICDFYIKRDRTVRS